MSLLAHYSDLQASAFGAEDRLPAALEAAVARGDALLEEAEAPASLRSVLKGVGDEAWTAFVLGMATKSLSAVSSTNNLGMFELTPRRLADLGVVVPESIQRTKHPVSKRTVWVADFKAPLTSDKFLRSQDIQYWCFAQSMRDYAKRLASGEITKDPAMSLSGALAILHRAGPYGLRAWARGPRLPETEAVFNRVQGAF